MERGIGDIADGDLRRGRIPVQCGMSAPEGLLEGEPPSGRVYHKRERLDTKVHNLVERAVGIHTHSEAVQCSLNA